MQHDPDPSVVMYTDNPHAFALSDEEKGLLIQCIDLAIKQSKNSIESASMLLPIAEKLRKKPG